MSQPGVHFNSEPLYCYICREKGNSWICDSGSASVYRVVEREGDEVVIETVVGTPQTIRARVAGTQLLITAITFASTTEAPGTFAIAFDPFLPRFAPSSAADVDSARFSIAIDDHAALVTGTAYVHREAAHASEPDRTLLSLAPDAPTWAVERAVGVEVTADSSGYHLQQRIGAPAAQ